MELLVDLFGYLSIVVHGLTILTQSMTLGGVPENPDEVYTRLAGHMQWAGLQELRKALEHKGVRLAVVNPTQLPAQLARQYLDVKRRQIL